MLTISMNVCTLSSEAQNISRSDLIIVNWSVAQYDCFIVSWQVRHVCGDIVPGLLTDSYLLFQGK